MNVAKSVSAPSTNLPLARARAFALAHIDLWLCFALMFAALWILLHYGLLEQPTPPDTTYHIYAAQQILEGHAIYRDVAIIKAPLADFLTSFALVIGRLGNISDTISARILFLLIAAATIGILYLSGKILFGSRLIGIIAALVVMGSTLFGESAVTGPEPKILVVLFSFATFLLVARWHWLAAGFCAALAALAWQPAAMVMALALGAALFAPWFEKNAPNWKSFKTWLPIVRVIIGMSLPFAIVLIYLVLNDALLPAWNATIGANLSHFNNSVGQGPLVLMQNNAGKIANTMRTYCIQASENWELLVGGIGFVWLVLYEITSTIRQRLLPINLERTPFILYALGFGVFTLLDFDFCPDLFPLLPVVALCIGWAIWKFLQRVRAPLGKITGARVANYAVLALGIVAALAIINLNVLPALQYQVVGLMYKDQIGLVNRAASYLRPQDQLLSFGNAMILVELHRDNASKIVHLGDKSGRGVLEYEDGGMDGMLEGFEKNPPRLISLARITRQDWNADFLDWVHGNYRLVLNDKFNGVQLYLLKKNSQS